MQFKQTKTWQSKSTQDWASAAIKTSDEIFLDSTTNTDSRLLSRIFQKSVGSRVFFGSLFFWAAVYFIFVVGGITSSEQLSSAESTMNNNNNNDLKQIGVTNMQNEYLISNEERGHWMLSLLHSLITVLLSGYLLFRPVHTPRTSTLSTLEVNNQPLRGMDILKQWWVPTNASLPNMVAVLSFSASYFVVDTAFILSDVGYVIHHGITLACFLISTVTGRYVCLVLLHLFFAECGNVAFIAEHVFYQDGAWGMYVTCWFALTRILWVIAIVKYQWMPMFFIETYRYDRKWCIDLLIFLPSFFLCLGSVTYACMFLKHEMFGQDFIVVHD